VLAGDVAANLLHGAPCPVAVAPRGYTAPADGLRRIGVAFTDTPEGRVALAGAAGLARDGGGSVRCFTVVEPLGWTAAGAVPGWAPPFDIAATARAVAQEAAEAALEAIPDGVEATAEVLDEGPTVAALAHTSAPTDLLVCGSRGYGALRGVMAGSVSRGLAHSAECPLLVVPRGPAHESPLLHGGELVGAAMSPR
jgi:nucleotide-binding universal stress UspA family protein